MKSHPHRHRRWLGVAAGASLAITGLIPVSAAAQPGSDDSADFAASSVASSAEPQVDKGVLSTMEANGEADFWVHFDNRPDLSHAASIADWGQRGQVVYDALNEAAKSSQADVRAHLDSAGVEYSSFFITNAIKVTGGSPDTLDAIVNAPGVGGIYAPFEVEIPEVEHGTDEGHEPNAVEWGIADINADEVWEQYGVTGEGIVVATIDTGVQWDHPALVESYRGNNHDGTFTHDYNWYDAGHGNPEFPNDNNGHGTHVQGTMTGDDGEGNQIGVAPGSTWIAANGCCPSDEALFTSGEWMLAPTDLDGENPDPEMRPHIVNNSWGTTSPSNDPFMEEIFLAWGDAGMFGIFANGNSGALGCESSGAPGSLTSSYSVGNYNSAHNISPTSGRGPGEDGTLKPNIAAPGSNVRSAWPEHLPEGPYHSISGTSMASPHAAGAIALLWAGAPSLVGDWEETRNLLNTTAIDTEDLQCGGTAENNNVFGEGRLDALALLDAAPTEGSGVLAGVITDASSGDPVGGATVTIEGPTERTLTTGEDGTYSANVEIGDYEVTATAFGYGEGSGEGSVAEGETTEVDIALEPSDAFVVSGNVSDGSGLGIPLSATVSVDGTDEEVATDANGNYSLEVPAGTYTLTASADAPGYHDGSEEVTVDSDLTVDFVLLIDVVACEAPYYVAEVTLGDIEGFDEETAPDGWTVTDDEGNGQTWAFDNPGNRTNNTGGEGNFAIVDSDFYGSGNVQQTGLVSPSQDFSDVSDGVPVVEFKQHFQVFDTPTADVDYSLDGGDTWVNALSQTTPEGPEETTLVALEDAAGESDVQVRFYLTDDGWSWWWQVDEVAFGEATCTPDEVALITADPAELESTQQTDEVTEQTLTVGNVGTVELTWEFVDETSSEEGVVHEQEIGGTSGIVSDFWPSEDAGVFSAENFVVDDGAVITSVYTPGFWIGKDVAVEASAIDWEIFADDGGQPGDEPVWSFSSAPGEDGVTIDDNEITLDLVAAGADPAELGAGTYWLSVWPSIPMGVNLNDRWNWYQGTVDGTDAMLTDPDDLFGLGATDWAPIVDLVGDFGDLAMTIEGEIGEPRVCGADWLAVDTAGGTVAPGDGDDVTVTFDSTGLADGEYEAELCIGSDAANGPTTIVPVTLTVGEDEEPPGFEVERIDGADRYEVAANVAAAYPDGAETVYIASGQGYPDALTGGAAAAQGLTWQPANTPEGDPAPILLTNSNQDVPTHTTIAALTGIDPANVIVLGGTDSISENVEAALQAAVPEADFDRIDGADRYEVAAGLAGMFTNPEVVYVASGQDGKLADSLAAAATAAVTASPVLLVKADHIPAVTAATLDELAPSQIILAGGELTVEPEIEEALGAWGEVTRVDGANRYEVAANLAAGYDSADTVYLAAGDDDNKFADALTGGALAGSQGEPLLLTRYDHLPLTSIEQLLRLEPSKVVLFGGVETISEEIENRLWQLLGD